MAFDTSEQSGLRRAADAGLAVVAVLLEAAVFAAVVGALVYLLPGKFSVLVLSLYGLICIGLLQAAAVLVLIVMLLRLIFTGTLPREDWRAVMLCGGFLVVIALNNGYILALGHLWDRSFGFAVNDVVMTRFFSADQHVVDIVAAVFAVLGAFLDHITMALFHLTQAPLAEVFGTMAKWIEHNSPIGSPLIYGQGFAAGLTQSVWRRLAA